MKKKNKSHARSKAGSLAKRTASKKLKSLDDTLERFWKQAYRKSKRTGDPAEAVIATLLVMGG